MLLLLSSSKKVSRKWVPETCLGRAISSLKPFIHIPQIWLQMPWEIIWILFRVRKELCRASYVVHVERCLWFLFTLHLHQISTVTAETLLAMDILHFPPLSSPTSSSFLSVLFSINPANLLYSFPQYPTPHLVPWPPWRHPGKGCRLERKRVWIFPH